MKKVIRIIASVLMWLFVGVTGTVVLVLIAIQTPLVKREIVKIAENQVNNILNAELSVGELTGDFFTHLEVSDVVLLSADKDTIAAISELRLRYHLLPLLSGKIVVNEVVIDNPFVSLAQMPDSTWNVQHIVKPSEDEPDTTSSSFNMAVQVGKFALIGGKIDIESFNPQIPARIDSLNIDFSGYYSSEYQDVNIKEFRLVTHNPDLTVCQLGIRAKGDTTAIRLDELLLQTRENSLTAKGEYFFDREERSQVSLSMPSIRLDEFAYYLPDEFELKAHPDLLLDASLKDTELLLNMSLKDNNQAIDVRLLSYYLLEYLSDSTEKAPVAYDVALSMKHVDVRDWLDYPDMNYVVNGYLTAKGEGLDPHSMQANVKANFDDMIVSGNAVSTLDVRLDYNRGNADGEIKGGGYFGYLYLKPKVNHLLGNRPTYSAYLNTRGLNIGAFLGDEYKSDLNLEVDVNGSGFDLRQMDANGKVIISSSELLGVVLDTLNTDIDFIRQNLIVNSFLLEALSTRVNVQGNYNMNGNSDIRLDAVLNDVNRINKFVGIEGLETSINLNIRVAGLPDDLATDLQLAAGAIRYQEIRLDSLFTTVNGRLRNKQDIEANAGLQARGLTAGEFSLDSIYLTVQTDTKEFDVGLDIAGQEIHARLNSVIKLGEMIEVALSDLWMNYRDYVLQQEADTAFISIGSDEYVVDNFRLVSDSANLNQSICLDGKISRMADQDFWLEISNLNLAGLMALFAPDLPLNGLLNLDLRVTGEAVSPEVAVNMNVNEMILEQYRFDTVDGRIDILNKELSMNLNVIPLDTGKLLFEGKMPITVRLDSMKFDVVPKQTDSINFSLDIDQLPLSILHALLPVDEIAGSAHSNVSVSGTMGEPKVGGSFLISDGRVKMKLYGINYYDIQTAINLGREEIKVDTFHVHSKDGTMDVKGSVQFNSDVYKGDLNTSNLNVKFDRFNPLDHKHYRMEVSGGVDLEGKRDSVYFSGNLNVPEAQVYLPALMSLFGQRTVSEVSKPLLVMEMEKINAQDSIVYTLHPDSMNAKIPSFDFLNNLQGALKVTIPRNTWIRNDDMRIELSGDVEVRKHRDFFELFGTIDVVRGQYNMLGKVFVINTGTIAFQGGEKMNPILDIEATYSFRQKEGNRRELVLYVTGAMESPEIKFTMDNAEVSEGDAISYILFGTRMEDIGGSMGGDASDLAGTVASSLVSSQLTKLLGKTLNVDYIEFNTTSDFQNASITVGKYITNKLFVSYEQNIGNLNNLDDKTVARYEMTLEYELFKFLFLQLTSSPINNGFDVIFKFNSKK